MQIDSGNQKLHFSVLTAIGPSVTMAMFLFLGCLLTASVSLAADVANRNLDTLSFSRLLVRFKDDPGIAVAPDEFRVLIIEALRENGFNVRGAENLLFDQDNSHEARFVLGGTLTELRCKRFSLRPNSEVCGLGLNGSCSTNSEKW